MPTREGGLSSFSKFYLFVSEAKITGCLFYTYMVFMYLLLGWAGKASVQTLDFSAALQMGIVCIVIGLAQRIIIPQSNMTIPKSILWGAVSIAVSMGTALLGGWFDGFPLWCRLVFWGILIVGLVMMIVHLHVTLEAETRTLNEQLQKFQSQAGGRKGDSL